MIALRTQTHARCRNFAGWIPGEVFSGDGAPAVLGCLTPVSRYTIASPACEAGVFNYIPTRCGSNCTLPSPASAEFTRNTTLNGALTKARFGRQTMSLVGIFNVTAGIDRHVGYVAELVDAATWRHPTREPKLVAGSLDTAAGPEFLRRYLYWTRLAGSNPAIAASLAARHRIQSCGHEVRRAVPGSLSMFSPTYRQPDGRCFDASSFRCVGVARPGDRVDRQLFRGLALVQKPSGAGGRRLTAVFSGAL